MKNRLNVSACFVCLFLTTLCYSGSLNPPSAPTAGTMKPLDQVEPRTPITSVPYVISQSGSYYLTKNLTATTSAITINVDDVTLDLAGFTLAGTGSAAYYGVYIGGYKNIEIRNGTIRNFVYTGIHDVTTGGNHRRIINMRVMNNGRHGIYLWGSTTAGGDLVKDCLVSGNGASYTNTVYGIYLSSHCIVSGNLVYSNGNSTLTTAYGISVGTGSVVSGNTVRTNYGTGIKTTASCRIVDNTITDNRNHGLNSGDNCTIHNNTSVSNTVVGIYTGNHCTIRENTVISNGGNGISVGNDCIISQNTSNLNGGGIYAGDHVTITDNTISGNAASGIICTGGTITQNTVSLNNTAAAANWGGIVVSVHSQVKENTLEGNTKNNIYVTGYRNSIENNVISGSDYGINFGSTGNVYLNNRAASNGTNYNAAGNTDGGGNISF